MFYIKDKINIDKEKRLKYNVYNILSRVNERTGSKTSQQPVLNKVLIPAKQSALDDDLNIIKI